MRFAASSMALSIWESSSSTMSPSLRVSASPSDVDRALLDADTASNDFWSASVADRTSSARESPSDRRDFKSTKARWPKLRQVRANSSPSSMLGDTSETPLPVPIS
uniref:Uncharacterized protein n=1 Tax=Ixodes ricinus TaxID=34613 RepID=A0A6B0U8W7_IXORI